MAAFTVVAIDGPPSAPTPGLVRAYELPPGPNVFDL